jgi:threonine dehydratase
LVSPWRGAAEFCYCGYFNGEKTGMDTAMQDKLELPGLAGIERAHEQLAPYMDDTPLVRCELLSRALAADVWIKNETVTAIASFKLRGALAHLLRAKDLRGAVTSSTGNHGQGVAYGARAAVYAGGGRRGRRVKR